MGQGDVVVNDAAMMIGQRDSVCNKDYDKVFNIMSLGVPLIQNVPMPRMPKGSANWNMSSVHTHQKRRKTWFRTLLQEGPIGSIF